MQDLKAQSREPYEEPTIDDVPLASDEIMANACKGDFIHRGSGTLIPDTSCRNNAGACKSS